MTMTELIEERKNRFGVFEAVAVKLIRLTKPSRSGLIDGSERLKFTFQALWMMAVVDSVSSFHIVRARTPAPQVRLVGIWMADK